VANLTLSIDDDLLKRARLKALEHDTSVNALVRTFLDGYVGPDIQRAARVALLESARTSSAGSGDRGRTWTREDLYADRLSR
jgi:hypothetical protein